MQKNNIKACSFGVLSLFWTLFIWSNSMQTGETSGEMSLSIAVWFEDIFAFVFGVKPTFDFNFLVRKAAHFLEYAVLALLICFFLYFALYTKKKRNLLLFCTLPAGAAVAFIDEGIQMFTDGRAGLISDVMIDFCGVLFVTLVFFLIALRV